MIKLGQKVKDVITGYKGVVIGRCQYLTGCDQALVVKEGLDKDGKRENGEWFDESRLKIVSKEVVTLPAAAVAAHPGRDERLPSRSR